MPGGLGLILLILVIVFLVGGYPMGVYNGGYRYHYGGGGTLLLILLLVLLFSGRL